MPVAVTTIAPVPRVTEVFWNSMLVRSPRATSAVGSAAASLATGALSPVSAASCVSSVAERMIRPSAGTMSPASTSTMSPGTTSRAGTCTRCPSRSTRLCGTCIFDSASTLALALSSWREPRTTLSRMSSATMIPVGTSPMTKLTAVTAMSMMRHRLAQLLDRDLPDRRRLLTGELVRAVARQPGRGLGLGQPVVGVGLEGGDDGCLVLREPRLRPLGRAWRMPFGRRSRPRPDHMPTAIPALPRPGDSYRR